ncbi:MAG: acyl-CoA/acyl-ACP dehydrogenase [Methylococcaceae bacterium]|nr:acyl-CoA/acyl-ACP dehydrogenase [Methylococcaceae bacterium]MCI0734539.1 acyl-CoA/acyl-ACP dehydrogenase [Methylococcaceae bacterium]
MNKAIQQVRRFVDESVRPFMRSTVWPPPYPEPLVSGMRELGLFGLGIPRRFGGLDTGDEIVLGVFRELAKGCLSLCALLGSHLRVARYLEVQGTEDQKKKFLPAMANGKVIAAHAHSEAHRKDPVLFETRIRETEKGFELSGRKGWVTNAAHADLIAVVAGFRSIRYAGLSVVVALIDPSRPGVEIGPNLPRMGIHGVSVCPVVFHGCPIGISDIVGELHANGRVMFEESRAQKYLNLAARAVGVGEELLAVARGYLASNPALAEQPVVRLRLAEAETLQWASEAALERAIGTLSDPMNAALSAARAKVFCTDALNRIAETVMQLHGGAGYAAEGGPERIVRDSISLTFCGEAKDRILGAIGTSLLNPRSGPTAITPAQEASR